ncbi:ATP-dependent helicase [Roseibium sp. RKSG952]|uniref:ATP-dependent helicase n=1 Tax=Roseibium sp. RKSG952 TaxID=2529384 RepID=UPI0012BCAE29|nr:ATP-dependent helicase [Roseibium sp. RKSG952]MTH95388.1 ATP-dependent helicase [Roseibium sp. RKSG952]
MGKLNKGQAAAASHGGGHALVLAGPGTGKTSTLVARYSFLNARGVSPDAMMVMTFTSKAAEELKVRLGDKYDDGAWIGTFHATCMRLLKRFFADIGLRQRFKVLDPAAQREILSSIDLFWNADDGDLVDVIGRWKDSMIDPDQAAADAHRKGSVPLRRAAEYYAAYEREIARRGDLDFSDLVTKALEALSKSGDASEFVRSRIRHVLVDEFQDVNLSQVRLLTLLAEKGAKIWAVADDDQALYGWRGGDVGFTVNFTETFKGAVKYNLAVNYRCDPAILAAANTLISNNQNRLPKKLEPSRPHRPGTFVRIRGFATAEAEAEFIAQSVEQAVSRGLLASSIAVLVRTSSVTPAVQASFEKRNIPFLLSGSVNFWDLPEVRAVADLLFAIESGSTDDVWRYKGGRDIVVTMKGSHPAQSAPAAGRLIGDHPPAGVNAERAAQWADASEAAASLALSHKTAAEFSAYLEEMSARGASGDGDGVAISSIHSSKGLEWTHVFVAGCEAAMLPHIRNKDKEEERRLLYVAVTRSKNSVDLSFVRSRFSKSQTPSPFLSELSKSPTGAVKWIGGEAEEKLETESGTGSRRIQRDPITTSGGRKIYRRKGRRSLIPPDED